MTRLGKFFTWVLTNCSVYMLCWRWPRLRKISFSTFKPGSRAGRRAGTFLYLLPLWKTNQKWFSQNQDGLVLLLLHPCLQASDYHHHLLLFQLGWAHFFPLTRNRWRWCPRNSSSSSKYYFAEWRWMCFLIIVTFYYKWLQIDITQSVWAMRYDCSFSVKIDRFFRRLCW